MGGIRLALLNDEIAFSSFIEDAENLKKIPLEKVGSFIDWVTKVLVHGTVLFVEEAKKFAEDFGFSTVADLNSAIRLVNHLFKHGVEISESDLESDFEKLGFDKDRSKLIITSLKTSWLTFKDFIKRQRGEAVPELVSIHWRIDARAASSDYLEESEVVALLRLGDSEKHQNRICVELDLDDLLWLEKEVGKIKKEFLKVQEKLKKNPSLLQ
ncbi:MAG: hypothetical protein ABSC91_11105 [Candidatus Bathyarchaeia archaeon]